MAQPIECRRGEHSIGGERLVPFGEVHFVTDGIRVALERARDAAHGKDVRIGGGAATIRQYLRERLIDELYVAIAPILLGAGEPLFDGINLADLGYTCTEHVPSQRATHIVLTRT